MKSSIWPETLTAREAARLLRVAPRTMYRYVKSGVVPRVHLGTRTVRIPRRALERLLDDPPGAAAPRPPTSA